MLPRIRPIPRLAALLLPAGAAGCLSSTTDVTGVGPGTVTPTTPSLRVVQGVSDAASGVDAAISGTTIFTNAQLGVVAPNALGAYYIAPSFTPQFAIASSASAASFFNQPLASLTTVGAYTVVAYGRSASGGAPAATVAVLADTAADSTRTTVLLRAFNTVDYVTSGSGTPVDVFIYPAGTTRPSAPDVQALAWGARSPYVAKQPGTLQVDVFATGTAGSTSAPLFSAAVSTAGGSLRTLVLLDPPAGAGTTAKGSVLALADYR